MPGNRGRGIENSAPLVCIRSFQTNLVHRERLRLKANHKCRETNLKPHGTWLSVHILAGLNF